MSEDNTVDRLLVDMVNVYQGVDVRIIAIRKDVNSFWQSFLTVIRFTAESTSKLSSHYNALAEKHPLLNSDNIRLIMKALPLAEWNSVKRQIFDTGSEDLNKLVIDDLTVHYWQCGGLPTHKLYPSTMYEFKFDNWPVFQVGLQERMNPMRSTKEMTYVITAQSDYQHILENEVNEALRCGFSDVRKAASYYMEARYGLQRTDPNIYIVMPLYAKMSEPFFEKNKIIVEITSHTRMPLQVNYTRGQPDPYASAIIEEHASNQIRFTEEGKIDILRKRLELEEVKADYLQSLPDDLITVSLAYLGKSGSEIISINKPLRHLVASGSPEVANPLFSVLQLFCSDDYISKSLLEPHGIKKSITLKPAKLFERTVAWILQSGGYDTIWLTDRDALKDPETDFNYGAADILAFHPSNKHLYVIGCSLKPPKHDELLDVVRLANRIDETLFGKYHSGIYRVFDLVKVIAVYIYSWDTDSEITSIASRNGVLSISRAGLQKMKDELYSVKTLKPLYEYKDEQGSTPSPY